MLKIANLTSQPMRSRLAMIVGLIIFIIVVSIPFLSSGYTSHIASRFMIYLVLSIGLSLAVNSSGLLNLGYVAIFGVGAYLYGILNVEYSFSFWIALPLGGMVGTLCGIAVAFPSLRVRGDYLAVVTLSFGEITRLIALNWSEVTQGSKGIFGISAPSFYSDIISPDMTLYYLILVLTLVVIGICIRYTSSPFPLILTALKEDEVAASTLGLNAFSYFLKIIAIGGGLAGLCGVLFAAQHMYFSPQSITLDESILLLCIAVLAGRTSIANLVIATTIFFLLPEMMRGLQDYRTLIFGVFVVVYTVGGERFSSALRHLNMKPYPLIPDSFNKIQDNSSYLRTQKTITKLIITKLEKNFGGVKALRNLSLTLDFERNHTTKDNRNNARCVGLVGPNGAGKSTLFNCITGVDLIDKGSIVLNNNNITLLNAYEGRKVGLGRTFQNGRLFKSMNCYENVLVSALSTSEVSKWSWMLCTKRYQSILNLAKCEALAAIEFCNVAHYAESPVHQLSPGHRKLVEIARAICLKPSLLLLDEPASGLNANEKQMLVNCLHRIVKELNISILIIEHDMPFIMSITDHIVVLDAGEILAKGTPEEIQQNKKVINAYLGSNYAT